MVTKEELAAEVSEALDMDIEFTKLRKDDLEKLHRAVIRGELAEPQMRQYVKANGKEALQKQYEEFIDDWYPGKFMGKVM